MFRAAIIVEVKWQVQKHADRPLRAGLTHLPRRWGTTASCAIRPFTAASSNRVTPSIVAAVECAIAIQKMMAERNAAVPEAKRILYRIGVNLGDVLIEGDELGGGRFLERAVERADGGADGLRMSMSCSAEPGMDSLLDLRVKWQFAGSASRQAATRAKRGDGLEIGRGIRG